MILLRKVMILGWIFCWLCMSGKTERFWYNEKQFLQYGWEWQITMSEMCNGYREIPQINKKNELHLFLISQIYAESKVIFFSKLFCSHLAKVHESKRFRQKHYFLQSDELTILLSIYFFREKQKGLKGLRPIKYTYAFYCLKRNLSS